MDRGTQGRSDSVRSRLRRRIHAQEPDAVVRRFPDPPEPGEGTCERTRHAAARRTDQLPGHRVDALAKSLLAQLEGRSPFDYARSPLYGRSLHAYRGHFPPQDSQGEGLRREAPRNRRRRRRSRAAHAGKRGEKEGAAGTGHRTLPLQGRKSRHGAVKNQGGGKACHRRTPHPRTQSGIQLYRSGLPRQTHAANQGPLFRLPEPHRRRHRTGNGTGAHHRPHDGSFQGRPHRDYRPERTR